MDMTVEANFKMNRMKRHNESWVFIINRVTYITTSPSSVSFFENYAKSQFTEGKNGSILKLETWNVCDTRGQFYSFLMCCATSHATSSPETFPLLKTPNANNKRNCFRIWFRLLHHIDNKKWKIKTAIKHISQHARSASVRIL